jgi:hypothetical protein
LAVATVRTSFGARGDETIAEPRIRFRRLPLAVRVATMGVFFLSWVPFAELVIDRYGLDRYLPLYRVADEITTLEVDPGSSPR